MPKKQPTAASRARAAAREGAKYTAALRAEQTTGQDPEAQAGETPDLAGGVEEPMRITVTQITLGPPEDVDFGGHEFEYERHTDLFRCTECQQYEVVVRSDDGSITQCPGLAGYGNDTERVYLLLTETQARAVNLAWLVRKTGIGRAPKFSWRDGKLLVESAPSVVDDLVRQIAAFTIPVPGLGDVRAATSVERLTAEQGRAVLAENYAAYVAKYGQPGQAGK
jgi:hypothetical protein